MKNQKTKSLAPRLISLSFVAMLAACDGPSYEGDELMRTQTRSASSADDETDPSKNTSSSGEEDDETTSSKPAAKGECAGETSSQSCLDCCSALSPGAVDVYTGTYQACICESPGACASECGESFCAGTQPDAACKTCLKGATTCDDKALSACEKDDKCSTFLSCSTASGCSKK